MIPASLSKSLIVIKRNLDQLSRHFCGFITSFSLIFPYAIATSYHSNLRLFLVADDAKCIYENDNRLKLR